MNNFNPKFGLKQKTLLVSIYHPFVIDRKGDIFFKDQHGLYLDNISTYFDKVYLLADKVSFNEPADSLAYRKAWFNNKGESVFYRYALKNHNIHKIMIPFIRGGISQPKNWFKVIKKLFYLFKYGIKADIIYIFTPSLQSIAAVAVSVLFKKKLILYVSNEWAETSEKYTSRKVRQIIIAKMLKIAEQLSVKRAALVLVTSGGLLHKYLGVNKNVKKVKPLLLYGKEDIAYDKKFNKEILPIITVAHIYEFKRLMDIVKALALLYKRHIPFELSVVGSIGDTGYYQEVMAFINREKISGFIRFHGLVTDKNILRNLYLNNDVFVLTSKFEGFPKVIYEAIIHSNIVVISDIPAYTNFADRKIYKVPVGDYQKLACVLEEIYYTPQEQLKELSKRALEEISFIFDSTPARQFAEEARGAIGD